MRIFFLFVVLVLITVFFPKCSSMDTEDVLEKRGLHTDIEFASYIQQFEKYSKIDTSSVPVSFGKLKKGVAGTCYQITIEGVVDIAYIEINKRYWGKMSEKQKIQLIFHEFGHCVLDRDHVDWQTPNECPSSFMHDCVISNYCLGKYFNVYLKEMFLMKEGL